MTSNRVVSDERNPVVFEGHHIRMLRSGNSELELLQLAEFMEKYSELGFRVVQSFYENKGLVPAEGNVTVIMEYDQVQVNAVFEANKTDRGY